MSVKTELLLINKFQTVRAHSIEICKPLKTEDYIPQPVVDVSPPKWHLGHTTWFFEEFVLKKYKKGYKEFNSEYNYLFNSYYESVGERVSRDKRGFLTRPTVSEVYDYRNYINYNMDEFLSNDENITAELEEVIILGLNHEQQHQELLWTDIKYIMGTQPSFPAYSKNPPINVKNNCSTNFEPIKGGIYEIGHKGKSFHFDNEKEVHEVIINDFEIRKGLVSNSEYLNFIEDGGYKNFKYWHSEGWAWVTENDIKSPFYWHKIDGNWFIYELDGLKPIDLNAPVLHLSYYEAYAFTNYCGLRLPTEFEWEVASEKLDYGDAWEWTNSAYLPYPGFRTAEGAIGEYNGKFMVSQMVLRGHSIATPEGHSRKTYRNFWHPKYQWQFTSLRLVRDKYSK